ncbi:MAG: cobalamin-dependent protein [Gemmatimonadota bacterium]
MIEPAPGAAREIRRKRADLAEASVDREFRDRPELEARWGPEGRSRCLEDVERHIDYLAEAVGQGSQSLFDDYVAWARLVLDRLGIPASDLRTSLEILRGVLDERLSRAAANRAVVVVDRSLRALASPLSEPACFLEDPGNRHRDLARAYLDALLRRDRSTATELVMNAVDGGVPIRAIYLNVFQPIQYEIGRLWQTGQVGVAEEHYCSAATQVIMSMLYPRIFAAVPDAHTMVAACVGGDLHEIGLRMVADFFEMEGWDTTFLGANTPLRSLVAMVEDTRPDLLALSATMAFHVSAVGEVTRAVRRAAPEVRILVGGYPFRVDPQLWRRVGADGTAQDAEGALRTAAALIEGVDHAG